MTTAQMVPTQIDKRAVFLAAAADPAPPLTVEQVLTHVVLIQKIMSAAMKEGEHYGRIPGCGDKPTLLKPGAEKLCLTFRLAPTYNVEEHQLERGHREYRVTATLTSITTQVLIGQGVGSCSTMEGKYRFRAGQRKSRSARYLASTGKYVRMTPPKRRNSSVEKVFP